MPTIVVRKCTRCGSIDDRHTWNSPDQAAREGAFEGVWACSSCAWPEFELIEVDAASVRPQERAGAR